MRTPPHDRSYEVTLRKHSSSTSNGRTNGHAGTTGHAAALESVADDALAARFHRAGSVDATADVAAGPATSAGARANRDACAELAQADPAPSAEAEGKWLRPPG